MVDPNLSWLIEMILLTTVFGVILQLGGLGFVNTAYSLFLKEQVRVTHAYTYHACMRHLCTHIIAWPNSRKNSTCFSSHFSTSFHCSSPDWEAGWQNCKFNKGLMKLKPSFNLLCVYQNPRLLVICGLCLSGFGYLFMGPTSLLPVEP